MALIGPTTNRKEIRLWADTKTIIPVELEPHRVNAEPAAMALLALATAESTPRAKIITWEDFFAKFESLGLTLVYDQGTAYNEILKVETDSENLPPPPYRMIAAN